ncbi:uncharacterized protein METZ01_LOCUS34067, partial [marine metagenome]
VLGGLGGLPKRELQGLLVGVGDVVKVGEESRVGQAPLTNLGDVLVEFGPAPTVIRPFGAGMAPHGQAVVGGSVHQKLGQVKTLFPILHTDTLCANNRALPVIHGLIAWRRRII